MKPAEATPTQNKATRFGQAEVRAMSDEELRVKVAELCGYEIGDLSSLRGRPMLSVVGKDGKHWQPHEYAKIPNYPSDLNAMHEAEKLLTGLQYISYCKRLAKFSTFRLDVGAVSIGVYDLFKNCIHATARQRAEAFVLTLGLSADSLKHEGSR